MHVASFLCLIGLALGAAWPRSNAHAQPTSTSGDSSDSREIARLDASIDSLLDDPRLDGIGVALTVRSATTGELIYDRAGDHRMMPASNQKLMTSAAALADLGPDYQFRTSVLVADPPRGGVVNGDLYLRGGGDPTLRSDQLDSLATAIAARGVFEVRGGLVGDDTLFDTLRLGTDWSWQDETFAYAAPISALSIAPDADFNTGSVQVDILPGPTIGAPAQVGLTPPTRALRLENHVVTGQPGSVRQLTGAREYGTNRIVVNGTIPLDGRPAHPLESVDDPAVYATDVFAAALSRHGVRLRDDTLRRGSTPAWATELAFLNSSPLREILIPLLKTSNNPMAEMLVKTMGAQDSGRGTWAAGLGVVLRFLATAGLDPTRVQLVDGSGLSTSNLVAPDDLTTLLVGVQREPWFDAWYAALPIAGEPERLIGGTLALRMRDTPAAGNVHAKTGTLTTASALSGYVRTAAGEQLVFSIMTSGFIGSPPSDVEDRLAVTLAEVSACLVACAPVAPLPL